MKNRNSTTHKLVETIAAIAMSMGLVFGCFIIVRSVFFHSDIKDSEVNVTAVLLAVGLLGNVLNYVLEKFVKDTFEAHFRDKIRSLIDDRVNEAIADAVPPIKKSLEDDIQDAIEMNEKEKYENQIIEKGAEFNNEIKDTVIVPVKDSYDTIKRTNKYTCPSHFSFKDGLKFIAFYIDKKIVGYGEIISNYNTPVGQDKIFEIREYHAVNILHERKGAFLQNKRYCNSEKLKNARNTDDLI